MSYPWPDPEGRQRGAGRSQPRRAGSSRRHARAGRWGTPRQAAHGHARAGTTRAQKNPLPHVRFTNPQEVFLSITARLALWRAANQIGKSFAIAADIVHTARGTHPFRPVRRPPVRLLVVSYSQEQMEPLLEKIWDLLPKDEIDPKVNFSPGAGLTGYKKPHIKFVSGPGKGSVIYFATYKQGSKRIAGGSYHGCYLDEPPPAEVYGEIMPRLTRHGGFLRIGFTPTPESADVSYLRDLVKKGMVFEHQTSLSEDATTPRGGLVERPWMSEAAIKEFAEALLDVERDMRLHGSWDRAATGRWLTCFMDSHIQKSAYPRSKVVVSVGIDHGVKAGRQCATLTFGDRATGRVWFVDEARSDGRTSNMDDARAIISMLERHQLTWKDVDYWTGDRATSGDFWSGRKSNDDLLYAFSKVLKLPKYVLKEHGLRIETPRKGKGSVMRGVRLMNAHFKEEMATVHPRCEGLVKAGKEWEGDDADPLKDPLDAARYSFERLLDEEIIREAVPATARIY